MSNELSKFMINKNVKSFHDMKGKIGETVEVIYNKMVPNMPPVQMKVKGNLELVKDFVGVKVGGKAIHFANKMEIIAEILDDKTRERLYDATLIVNNSTKFTDKTREKLGLIAPESKVAYSATKQFNASLNQ